MASLLHEDCFARLSDFDWGAKCAHSVSCDEFPWPCAFLLTFCSKKHGVPSKPPLLSNISVAAASLCRKLEWRWVHRNNTDEQVHRRFHNKPCQTSPDIILPPELRRWCSDFQRHVNDAANKVLCKARFYPRRVPAIVALGINSC